MSPNIKYTVAENFRRLQINQDEKTTKITEIQSINTQFIFRSECYPSFDSVKIMEIEKIPSTWKETFKIKLDKEINYDPCDAIGLLIPNSDFIVDEILKFCNIENFYIRIERSGLNSFIFEGSVRDFIKYKMDLNTLPKKRHLMDLSKRSKKKECIEYLCSPEGTKDYLNMGLRMNTLLEIIKEFECSPSFEDLVNNCEIIKPRYYSLIQENGRSEILLGIISKMIDDQIVYGHVSGFIRSIYSDFIKNDNAYPNIEYCFRKNKLFDSIKSRNLVCYCTGTGIAPYIAFYRKHLLNGILDNLILIYGFRNDSDNLAKYYDLPMKNVILVKSSEGKYVQEFTDALSKYQNNCCVFICGNIKMQKNVFDKIKEEFKILVDEKRIYFDNWS